MPRKEVFWPMLGVLNSDILYSEAGVRRISVPQPLLSHHLNNAEEYMPPKERFPNVK